MSESNPHLSIIVAARNDNYGGEFIHRLQCFVYQLNKQWSLTSKFCELIIVDWNSIQENKPLKDYLSFVDTYPNFTIRLIEVPSKVHQSFPNFEKFGLYEYIAKNVGIRRAKGQFILATNPDNIFSDLLLNYLASSSLKKNCFYRTDRINFSGNIDYNQSVSKNFHTIESSVVFKHNYQRKEFRDEFIENKSTFTAASGDFWLAHKSIWYELCGYREWTTSSHTDSILCHEAVNKGIIQIVLPSRMNTFHKNHSLEDRKSRPRTNLGKWRILCSRDDEKTDRSKWGMLNSQFNEIVL